MSGKQREENKLSSRHISLVCQKFVPNDRVAILTLRNKKAAKYLILNGFCIYGAPREIRTPDPQVRSLVLYPAELWAHCRGRALCVSAYSSSSVFWLKKQRSHKDGENGGE